MHQRSVWVCWHKLFCSQKCPLQKFDVSQVDVAFEEVNEIVLLEEGLPFIAGRISEPVQPNLLRMRALLAASQHNVALVDGMDNVSLLTVGCAFMYLVIGFESLPIKNF